MAKQDTKNSGDKFTLPASSYEELKKIIQGYARRGEGATLEAIAKLTGITTDSVSRNNGFLMDAGIIAGGNAKSVTEIGKRLARAFEHDQKEAIANSLREVVQATAFLSDLPSTVRIKNGMSEPELVSHILYASDSSPKNARKVIGANAVVEMLFAADLLVDNNGKLQVQSGSPIPQAAPVEEERPQAAPSTTDQSAPQTSAKTTIASLTGSPLSIAINIQLQLPETDNPAVYDNLFKSLKKHLLTLDERDAE